MTLVKLPTRAGCARKHTRSISTHQLLQLLELGDDKRPAARPLSTRVAHEHKLTEVGVGLQTWYSQEPSLRMCACKTMCMSLQRYEMCGASCVPKVEHCHGQAYLLMETCAAMQASKVRSRK